MELFLKERLKRMPVTPRSTSSQHVRHSEVGLNHLFKGARVKQATGIGFPSRFTDAAKCKYHLGSALKSKRGCLLRPHICGFDRHCIHEQNCFD